MSARLRLTKEFIKLSAWILGIVLVLVLSFHLWFIYHSEKIIEDLISWQSNGKLRAVIKKFTINYVNNNIDIKDLSIFNTDSSEQSTTYHFSTQNFHLKIRSRWALVFKKQLLIDSIIFHSPDIVVIRKAKLQTDTLQKKLLLAEELGNIYKTIRQSLNVLNLQRFEMIDGRITIKEAGNGNKAPFKLSKIFLSIDKLNIDSSSVLDSNHFVFSDRVLLHIKDQKILLADNKSSVSFRELTMDSKEKGIRIIDPAIRIMPNAGQKNSLVASAAKVDITGLDFNALYRQPLIKVDSVYIESLTGDLQVYTSEKSNGQNKQKKIRTDSVLRHLPVAVNINHIVVQKANGVMLLHRGDKTNSFQTRNDNISILGVHINDTTENILDIDGFNYTIRNYVGYTPDSIYRFRFDSLQFINSKIVLYHFKAATVKRKQANLIRDYTVPRFEITGMDWISFVFDNHFRARNALLFDPVLHIEKNISYSGSFRSGDTGKRSIYQTLSVMDSILDLERLQILHGNFSFKQSKNADLQMQNLNLDINADELTQSKSINQIIGSVKSLSFNAATIRNATLITEIGKSGFSNRNGVLVLGKVLLNTGNNSIVASLNDVAVRDFSLDNNGIEVDNIQWKDGIIHVVDRNKTGEMIRIGNKSPELTLNNIQANNTAFSFDNQKMSSHLFIRSFSATSLVKYSGDPVQLSGMSLSGSGAVVNLKNAKIQSDDFNILDQKKSALRNLEYRINGSGDSSFVLIPEINFIPDVNQVFRSGVISADSVIIHMPVISLVIQPKSAGYHSQTKAPGLPGVYIKHIKADDATVRIRIKDPQENQTYTCERLSFSGQDLLTKNGITLSMANVLLRSFHSDIILSDRTWMKDPGNLTLDAGKVEFDSRLKTWQATIGRVHADELQYGHKENQKSEILDISRIDALNIPISTADIKQPWDWLINTAGSVINFDSLGFRNDQTGLELLHFRFDQAKKQMTANSFIIGPGKTRKDFINQLVYRKDYIWVGTGRIIVEGAERIGKAWHIPALTIDQLQMDVFSDKLIKPGKETIQPLPVPAIKKISQAFQIDSIHLINAAVYYEEQNAETKQTGHVYFRNIEGNLTHIISGIKNVSDSLGVHLHAKFLDKMQMDLSLHESYGDPLHGLDMQLSLGHGDLGLLNAFLVPLVSMRVRSGYLDTMMMSSVANENGSHGYMRLYYHGLRADFLDSGNLTHKKFRTKLLVFFANTFAIRNKNDQRKADFSFARIKQKSSISYFLKMIVEGASASVAPVSKIIFKKQNKRELGNGSAPSQ